MGLISKSVASPSLFTTMRSMVNKQVDEIKCHTYARIISVDTKLKRITVQPLIKQPKRIFGNYKKLLELAPIKNIPYIQLVEPVVGQDCILLHLDNSINSPISKKGFIKFSKGKHKMSACIALCIGYSMTELNTTPINIPNQIHPIDSIYISMGKEEPGDLFGGVWERLSGVFLYANPTPVSPSRHVKGGSKTHNHSINIISTAPTTSAGAPQPSSLVTVAKPEGTHIPPYIGLNVWRRLS